MTEEWIATREPVTLKVSGGEEHTFPPGTMFKLQRVYGGGDPAITGPGAIEIKESENSIRQKIARAETRVARAEKRGDTWRAVVTGVTIGVVLKLVDLAGWVWGVVFNQ